MANGSATIPFIPTTRAETMTLIVKGRAYDRWKHARVTLRVDSAFQEFQFSTSEPVDIHEDWDRWNIRTGDPCEVHVGGIPVTRGFIDIREAFYDAHQHGVMFYGRDYNCNCYESSVRMGKGQPEVQLIKATFSQIMGRALQGTGTSLEVTDGSIDSYIFPNFSISFGETPWNVGERLKRYIPGLRITSDPRRKVWVAHIARLNAGGATFVEGENILSARAVIDSRAWMPLVHSMGQQPARDEMSGKDAAEVEGFAYDNSLPETAQPRYFAQAAADPVNKRLIEGHAAHELLQRGEDAVHCTIQVYTWWERSGELYWIFKPYTVNSPMLGMDQNPLWSRMVTFEQSDAGSTTTLELASKTALSPWWERAQPTGIGARGPGGNYAGQGVLKSEIDGALNR